MYEFAITFGILNSRLDQH